ncbi:MAG: NADP-dependent oxidoreductase [Betaproteobacteria bacterium]|nr:NADP-dependent oxidoreductase [Betaproteobacteria bacterium]
MEYRRLGASGIRVSPICLGTMMFGERTDEAEAGRIVASAREAGVNFIDTADTYASNNSERITGKLIAEDRTRWILATKVTNPHGSDPNDRGASRRWLNLAIEHSLKRLGTDYIDIWYLHRDDAETPMEETVATLGELMRAGKIRYIGLSNFRAWRVALFVATCKAMGVPPPIVCQPCYNAMDRTPELELIPACMHHGLAIVPYSPLARGVLSAKYKPGEAPPPESRAGRKDKRLLQTEFRDDSLRLAQVMAEHAHKRGMAPGEFAFNWVLNNRYVTSVIAGPRTMEQWTGYMDSFKHSFTAEDEALVDSLVAPGHPSTQFYTDPIYPVLGRASRAS